MRSVRFIPAVIWTALMLKLLLSESSGLPRLWWLNFPFSDKVMHAGIFGVNSLLLLYALRHSVPQWHRLAGLILLWTVVFGASTELAQHCCVESRTGDVFDLLADLVGGVLPLIFFQMKFAGKVSS